MSFSLTRKMESSVDKDKVFGDFLTNLSKAFHCFNHELLIMKLNAYGFTITALQLVHDYC